MHSHLSSKPTHTFFAITRPRRVGLARGESPDYQHRQHENRDHYQERRNLPEGQILVHQVEGAVHLQPCSWHSLLPG